MAEGTITTGGLDDAAWNTLLERINRGNCTPFIGPGARIGFPDSHEVARLLAAKHGYPLGDCLDLPKVTRFVAVKEDPAAAKDEIIDLYEKKMRPDFADPANSDDPHRMLAELPFPVYITTNQDDLMWQALRSRRDKDPKRELCRWSGAISDAPKSVLARDQNPPYQPTVANPLLFHLYGYTDYRDSLVVTDDDYMEFLINISQDQSAKEERMMPPRIEQAMAGASLLLGYRLDDWDFRVLFHIIINHMVRGGRTHVAVQLSPADDESARAQEEKVKKQLEVYQAYVGEYFRSKRLKIHVSLQTCQEFVTELRDRWRKSPYA
jgi:hypothetical protein